MKKIKLALMDDNWRGATYQCLACRQLYIKRDFAYCPMCGQDLKDYEWEDYENEDEDYEENY